MIANKTKEDMYKLNEKELEDLKTAMELIVKYATAPEQTVKEHPQEYSEALRLAIAITEKIKGKT